MKDKQLNEMKKKGQYDEWYSINGEIVFDKSKKDLQKIFADFPNKGEVVNLIHEIKGLYPSLFPNLNISKQIC